MGVAKSHAEYLVPRQRDFLHFVLMQQENELQKSVGNQTTTPAYSSFDLEEGQRVWSTRITIFHNFNKITLCFTFD